MSDQRDLDRDLRALYEDAPALPPELVRAALDRSATTRQRRFGPIPILRLGRGGDATALLRPIVAAIVLVAGGFALANFLAEPRDASVAPAASQRLGPSATPDVVETGARIVVAQDGSDDADTRQRATRMTSVPVIWLDLPPEQAHLLAAWTSADAARGRLALASTITSGPLGVDVLRSLIVSVAMVAVLAGSSSALADDLSVASAGPDCPVRAVADPGVSPAPSPALTEGPLATPVSCVDGPVPTDIVLEAGDLWFDLSEIRLPAGATSTITLVNVGYAPHNLTIDELDLLVAVARGREVRAMLDAAPAGTYAFYCSVSGHREAGMEGVLVIE